MADGTHEPVSLERLLTVMRPRLHRYCARMVGSAFDGEDVVQDAMVKAADAWPGPGFISRPEPWLFRIAHNAALDALRRQGREAAMRSHPDLEEIADAGAATDVRVAAASSLAAFMDMPVVQRSSVILVDVLGHDPYESLDILGLTLPALKAALHRGRATLRKRAAEPQEAAPALDPAERERLQAYADRFNNRDFDALRGLLAEDVRLDLANRVRLAGRKDVEVYFGRYDESADWRLAVGMAEGRPALLVSRPEDPTAKPTYVVLLDWTEGEIAMIHDYRYAPYVMKGLDWSAA